MFDGLRTYAKEGNSAYLMMMSARPQAVGYGLTEVYRAPESWARRDFRNLIYFHEADKGGHFAAWEYPELFAAELRAAFKSVAVALEKVFSYCADFAPKLKYHPREWVVRSDRIYQKRYQYAFGIPPTAVGG